MGTRIYVDENAQTPDKGEIPTTAELTVTHRTIWALRDNADELGLTDLAKEILSQANKVVHENYMKQKWPERNPSEVIYTGVFLPTPVGQLDE